MLKEHHSTKTLYLQVGVLDKVISPKKKYIYKNIRRQIHITKGQFRTSYNFHRFSLENLQQGLFKMQEKSWQEFWTSTTLPSPYGHAYMSLTWPKKGMKFYIKFHIIFLHECLIIARNLFISRWNTANYQKF